MRPTYSDSNIVLPSGQQAGLKKTNSEVEFDEYVRQMDHSPYKGMKRMLDLPTLTRFTTNTANTASTNGIN